MPEVFQKYETPLIDEAGVVYVARACGRERPDGAWEGWLEFVPGDGGPTVRTRRETTQATRGDLAHWARGLTAVYLEGALERALVPLPVAPVEPPARPAYDRPAPFEALATETSAVLDPYSVRRHGEARLRAELEALDAWHLRNIVRAYRLADERLLALETLSAPALVELIVGATRRVAGARG